VRARTLLLAKTPLFSRKVRKVRKVRVFPLPPAPRRARFELKSCFWQECPRFLARFARFARFEFSLPPAPPDAAITTIPVPLGI
jgi:hypothetical protein